MPDKSHAIQRHDIKKEQALDSTGMISSPYKKEQALDSIGMISSPYVYMLYKIQTIILLIQRLPNSISLASQKTCKSI